MTARPKICIDRILPRDLMSLQPTTRGGGRTRAIVPIGKTWMNGSTLQVRFIGGTAPQKATVREQAGWWTEHANLKFNFNDAPGAEIQSASTRTTGPGATLATTAAASRSTKPQ